LDAQDPRRVLADRLRTLRERHLHGRKITQPQLAQALGENRPLSVPLISSWESAADPRIPPLHRLEAYAALFAAPRSFDLKPPRPLRPDEMTEGEERTRAGLRQELIKLRNDALRAKQEGVAPLGNRPDEPISEGPWRFSDGAPITIVCARWPQHMLVQMPYTDIDDPDYIEMLTYSDLDALFELSGHLRAVNSANLVNLRAAGKLVPDDYTSHLVLLGGIDWNTATRTTLYRLQLPVRQVADWSVPDGQYFEIEEGGKTVRHSPVLDRTSAQDQAGQTVSKADSKGILLEDVALFARAASPFNRKRTVTICNGMYGRGTYGAVRALTDARFRSRNSEYLRSRFSDSESYCILTRVPIVDGATLTPDWTTGEYTLFEWPG
jgi:transcriptional regulator with XRE-family HTH domain